MPIMKLTDNEGARLSGLVARLAEHWTSKPKVAGSIPTVVNIGAICLRMRKISENKMAATKQTTYE